MITQRIPALLLALTPVWLSASVSAEDISQADPVAAIDEKIEAKHSEISNIDQAFEQAQNERKQLRNDLERLKRDGDDLNAKRNRAKSALDKQYARLLDDPDTDLVSFQKKYQDAWAEVKENQSQQLEKEHAVAESEMRLSQLKQKQARLNNEFANLKESRIDARVARLSAELRESAVLETSYSTTCDTSMTLGECSTQGKYLTKQKAVNTFKAQLLDNLTEKSLAKQNLQGVQLNIHVQDSQIIKSGFSGNDGYFTQMQAQLQAKPEATAACKLLGVSTRYCLSNAQQTTKKQDKQWANVMVRSDQYNDAVTINGVKYGSTPVELALPKGAHQITVSKEGYETYNRVISVTGNDTVWVKMLPNKN